MRSNESKAYLYALICVLLWSTVATAFKLGLETLKPAQLLFGSACISLIFFVCFLTLNSGWSELRNIEKNDLNNLLLMGIMNPFLYYLLLFEAYDRLPAQIAQPLNFTWAIVYSLLAVIVLKQKLSRAGYLGMLISYIGVFVLLTKGQLVDLDQFDTLGILLAILSTFLWAGFWIMSLKSPHSAPMKMCVSFMLGTPLIGLVCYFTVGFPPLNQTTLVYSGWVGLIEMGLTFLLWQHALALTNQSARISQLIFISPLISLFLIHNVLGEQIHSSSFVALVLIIGGLLIGGRSTTS